MNDRFTEEELAQRLRENPDVKIQGRSAEIVAKQQVSGANHAQGGSNKYHAEKAEYNGRKYPSIHQAEVRNWLDMAVQAGKFDAIIEEVPFRLPGKTDTGRWFTHRVDFGALKDGHVVAWFEAKGRDLVHGKMKRRQVEEIFKVKIEVI